MSKVSPNASVGKRSVGGAADDDYDVDIGIDDDDDDSDTFARTILMEGSFARSPLRRFSLTLQLFLQRLPSNVSHRSCSRST